MSADPIERLVRDAAALTGGDLPSLLSNASPTLSAAPADGPPSFYLVGLIGGKDVGKSSLANALAGVDLGTPSDVGEGTRDAIAYVHRDVEGPVAELLTGVIPGRFSVLVHDHAALRSQVLLDLPDIDSKYHDHVELTRSVLRHLLFPIFVQSVEKYADERPRRLLAQVAEGNDPANFLFCLSKVDQLVAREGEAASIALADDYANRVRGLLGLKDAPRVFRLSARQPQSFDLPELRSTLARERGRDDVRRSIDLASNRRRVTLVRWLEAQRLDDRLARADRTVADARELAEQRLIAPIESRVLPRLRDEAALRAEVVDAAARRRLARWPIVNVVDAVLSPLTSAFRRNVIGTSGARRNVAAIVADLSPPLDANVRSLFADVRRRDPTVGDVYGAILPWDDAESARRVASLTSALADAMDRRRRRVTDLVGGGHGRATAPLRWLLTLGACVWFPIVQPLLEIALDPTFTWTGLTLHTAWQLVRLLGATYLLQSVGFLAIYFVLLWATLRFVTGRRVERLIDALDADDALADAGPTAEREVAAWVDELLAPLAARTDELRGVVERLDDARQSIRAA